MLVDTEFNIVDRRFSICIFMSLDGNTKAKFSMNSYVFNLCA